MNQQTFQNIVNIRQNPNEEPWINLDPRYHHNSMVLEVANNFKQVRWLVHLWREGELKQVTHFEKELLDFVMLNGIQILDNYTKDEEQKFLTDFMRWDIPDQKQN